MSPSFLVTCQALRLKNLNQQKVHHDFSPLLSQLTEKYCPSAGLEIGDLERDQSVWAPKKLTVY